MKTALRRAGVFVAVALSSSCATSQQQSAPPAATTAMSPAPLMLPFNAADVAWSRGAGTATVEGRAAIGAARQTCAGGEAQLFAASPYAAEMMRMVFGSDVRGFAPMGTARYPANVAAEFPATVRRAGCDAEGRFRFDAVPAGRWYVFSNVVYRAAGADSALQGGALMQRIDVAEGARADVQLAP